MKNNLYFIVSLTEDMYYTFFNSGSMLAKEWHIFLGHPSITTMRHLCIGETKFTSEALKEVEKCEICIKFKQTRESFPILNRRSSFLFEMVHGDLWGPYDEYNICNVRYVLTLVEDHTRTIWTYLLQTKDQVYDVLAGFIQMIATHFQRKILYFRSDHGSEFLNRSLSTFYR